MADKLVAIELEGFIHAITLVQCLQPALRISKVRKIQWAQHERERLSSIQRLDTYSIGTTSQ